MHVFQVKTLFLVTALKLQLQSAVSQLSDPATVEVGDEVCFEGFIMDFFCINRGTLLDDPSTTTLLNPEKHSVHCLVDISVCNESNYNILKAPAGGEELYTRAFQFDDSTGKQQLISAARAAGLPSGGDAPSCTTCTGGGTLERGFRAEIRGTVTVAKDGDEPAFVELTSVTASNDKDTVCNEMMEVSPVDENTSGTGNSASGISSTDRAVNKVVSSLAVASMGWLSL